MVKCYSLQQWADLNSDGKITRNLLRFLILTRMISFQPSLFVLCTMDLFTYFRPLVLETNKQHERKFSEVQ
jgi:hypothetical protein